MTKHDNKDIADSAANLAASSVDSIKSQAQDAAAKLRDAAAERVDAAKDTMVDQGLRIADSLRKSMAGHGEDSLQERVIDVVAKGVADLSEGLRSRNLGSVLTDVQGFARRNPGAFIAGAAIAGFALARFTRSSHSARADHASNPDNAVPVATNQVPSAPSEVQE